MRARDGQACHFRPRPFRRSFLAVLPSAARGRAGFAPPPPPGTSARESKWFVVLTFNALRYNDITPVIVISQVFIHHALPLPLPLPLLLLLLLLLLPLALPALLSLATPRLRART
jgi:hypothetical protein